MFYQDEFSNSNLMEAIIYLSNWSDFTLLHRSRFKIHATRFLEFFGSIEMFRIFVVFLIVGIASTKGKYLCQFYLFIFEMQPNGHGNEDVLGTSQERPVDVSQMLNDIFVSGTFKKRHWSVYVCLVEVLWKSYVEKTSIKFVLSKRHPSNRHRHSKDVDVSSTF